jgi:glycosyltransferase involved in cell wall biosynthesis
VTVLLDVQSIQSPAHAERGVARYTLELALAIERLRPGIVDAYLLNPDLPVPPAIEPLAAAGRLDYVDRVAPSPTGIYHVASVFESHVPFDRLWPPGVRRSGMRFVATIYDVIPQLFSEVYLSEPQGRQRYRTRLELARRADRLFAISHRTAADVITLLNLPPEKVVVVGTGVSERFKPPSSRDAARVELRARFPRIEQRFVLFTGGIEPRKNIDRLLQAYAALPKRLQSDFQLVIVCRIRPEERAALEERLRELQIGDRVELTGFVSDDELTLFYQAATLFVFPSLYEGFGLPVAEALASRAPVVCSRIPALLELVSDEAALFDPFEVASISATLERALEDEALRARLASRRLGDFHRWSGVAERTIAAYHELLELPPRRRRSRRVAYVSPLPPQRSGVADYSFRLLNELGQMCQVDAFTDTSFGDPDPPPGVRVIGIDEFDVADRLCGGYDTVFVCLGNSEHHARALRLLRRRSAVVLAHDVRLSGLYAYLSDRLPEIEPRSFARVVRSMYGKRVPRELVRRGFLDVADADRYGIYMAREAIALSERFLAHSNYAAQLARLDATPGDARKVGVVPFAFPPLASASSGDDREPLVATFGLVAAVKQPDKLLTAYAELLERHPACRLALVGPPVADAEQERLVQLAARLGISARVTFTGDLPEEAFRSWIQKTTVAVQLRSISQGETPASVADCLAAGRATIVTALGAAREFPDEAVVKVPPDTSTSTLADTISSLLADAPRRAELGTAARAFASERSFERVAETLYTQIVLAGTSGARLAAA